MSFIRIFLLLAVVALSACSNVKPWERGDLARKEMTFVPDPMELSIKEHIYYSKEASTTGSAVSGGGCGCN